MSRFDSVDCPLCEGCGYVGGAPLYYQRVLADGTSTEDCEMEGSPECPQCDGAGILDAPEVE